MSALLGMYAKCGSIHNGHALFDKIRQKNMVSQTALVLGYTQNGVIEQAIENLNKIQLTRLIPNSVIFVSILLAYTKMGALEQGVEILQSIIETKILLDGVVMSAHVL